jgi:hypothetical protein
MNLQQAPERWTPEYQNRLNREIAQSDNTNRKRNTDIELGKERLILRSPNGQRWVLTVSNAGVLSATAL